MPLPQIFITPAGFAAIVNAENTGTAPVRLSHVGLTSLTFDPTTVGSALPGEFKRLTTFGGVTVAPDTLHLNVRDDGTDTYTVRGFGLYLADGTLLGVYSQPAPIMEKAAAATFLLATDIRFANINATSIDVGDIDFVNPPASTSRAGVVRLSTDPEIDAVADNTTAVTPRGLGRYIDSRFGSGAPTAFVKSLLGTATAAIFRVQLGLKSAAVKDDGPGNGLDADLLDGAHGAYYLDWKNQTNLPSSFNPSVHNHAISEITGLPTALDGKANRSGDTFTGTVAVNGGALRSYGWLGVPSNGVVFLGDTGSYVQKNGRYFEFSNSAGGYMAYLDNGGGIWTTGNFNPASKVNKNGDTMSGALTVPRFYVNGKDIGESFGEESICVDLNVTSSNGESLQAALVRHNAGGGWRGTAWRIRRAVDGFKQGYIDFGPDYTGVAVQLGFGDDRRAWLSTDGQFHVPGGLGQGSSRKLKHIEGKLPYGLAEVVKMETATGTYRKEFNNDSRRRLFFIAEQVMELVPEAVNPTAIQFNGERVPAILIEQLLPVFANAIKELHSEIQQLRQQVGEAGADSGPAST